MDSILSHIWIRQYNIFLFFNTGTLFLFFYMFNAFLGINNFTKPISSIKKKTVLEGNRKYLRSNSDPDELFKVQNTDANKLSPSWAITRQFQNTKKQKFVGKRQIYYLWGGASRYYLFSRETIGKAWRWKCGTKKSPNNPEQDQFLWKVFQCGGQNWKVFFSHANAWMSAFKPAEYLAPWNWSRRVLWFCGWNQEGGLSNPPPTSPSSSSTTLLLCCCCCCWWRFSFSVSASLLWPLLSWFPTAVAAGLSQKTTQRVSYSVVLYFAYKRGQCREI